VKELDQLITTCKTKSLLSQIKNRVEEYSDKHEEAAEFNIQLQAASRTAPNKNVVYKLGQQFQQLDSAWNQVKEKFARLERMDEDYFVAEPDSKQSESTSSSSSSSSRKSRKKTQISFSNHPSSSSSASSSSSSSSSSSQRQTQTQQMIDEKDKNAIAYNEVDVWVEDNKRYNKGVLQIEKDVMIVKQMHTDLNELVVGQGTQLDQVERNLTRTKVHVQVAAEQLDKAEDSQRKCVVM